jgi:HD-like signal output (HDOD) protein
MKQPGGSSQPVMPPRDAVSSAAAFEFVRQLAAEMSADQVDLPTFPDVAMRVQRVLTDESVGLERAVRVIGAEPALATRVLQMANSAALNRSGRPIADLRGAITRLGFDMLRSAAIAFAMAQLRRAEANRNIEKPLNRLWCRSVVVAATSFVVARRVREPSADTALLAGLLHNVGRLYILTRAARHPVLFEDAASYEAIVRDWHAPIARALLENWGVAGDIVDAIYTVESGESEPRGPISLGDVLSVALGIARFGDRPELLASRVAESRCASRLGLDPGEIARLLEDSRAELQALKEALGG